MDVTLARTLLSIVENGSFKAAADRLNVTQSTVSARVRSLEEALGQRLLERSKAGVTLTAAGEQFRRHAEAMVRIWNQAQLEVGLAGTVSGHFVIGGQLSLWDGLLLPWVSWMRQVKPDVAITAKVGGSTELIDRLAQGTLDAAVVYRAVQRPGVIVEHILDEALVLATSGEDDLRRPGENYIFVNWGPEFAADHAEAYPERAHTGLHLDLGVLGIGYLLETQASGYFPLRTVAPLAAAGRLRIARRARRFVYPVYLAYPEERDTRLYDPLLGELRAIADGVATDPGEATDPGKGAARA